MENVSVTLQKNARRYVEICIYLFRNKFFLFSRKFLFGLFRTKLPVVMFDRSQISIWSILKQCIGKVNN
jgi:hypothetical protein